MKVCLVTPHISGKKKNTEAKESDVQSPKHVSKSKKPVRKLSYGLPEAYKTICAMLNMWHNCFPEVVHKLVDPKLLTTTNESWFQRNAIQLPTID